MCSSRGPGGARSSARGRRPASPARAASRGARLHAAALTIAFAAVLAAALSTPASAAKSGASSDSAAVPASWDARTLRFANEILATHLDLAKKEKPYFVLDPQGGELSLRIRGVVLATFPAEGTLLGHNLGGLIRRRAAGTPVTQAFTWISHTEDMAGDALAAVSVTYDPPLRLEFQTSPSDFYWRRLRYEVEERLPWRKGKRELSMILFHDPESLVTLSPLLADSLPLVFAPPGK
jgi:hypothetical protein